jgi:sulfotransferase
MGVLMNLHFISGLPRSGSTLLAAILRQNQKIRAGISSPVGTLFNHLLMQMGAGHEQTVHLSDKQRRDMLRGLFDAYYADEDRPVVLDTNRIWCSRLPALLELFPKAKVIVCVREPCWVLDSLERLFRRNAFLVSRIIPPEANVTVYTRADFLTARTGLVGTAWNSIKEAYFGEFRDRLMFVDYADLTRNPGTWLDLLYSFLGIEQFKHDFENISFDGGSDLDHWLGAPGLHAIAPRVEFKPRQTILPPDIFGNFVNQAFWKGSEK